MSIDLSRIRALITGSSSGIGLAMAHALLARGASVALSARPGNRLKGAVNRMRDNGFKAFALPMDVRDESAIDKAVAWIRENWGSIDLLVNNAGLMAHRVNPDFFTHPEPFFRISPDYFRDAVETNLTGYFLVSRAFVPMMIEQRCGKIVNLSTSLTTMNRKGFVPYGPSRAGSEALSNIMAAELKEFGIEVNILLPGGPVDKGVYGDSSENFSKMPVELLDIGIMADPIVFLASPLSDGMTGERIIAKEFKTFLKDKGIDPESL